MRAVAADVDNDNDLDVVAAAYVPAYLREQLDHGFDSLIWLEQTSDHSFVRHRIETGGAGHMAIETGDFDGDGFVDIAAGSFANSKEGRASETPWVHLWWGGRNE